MFRHRPSHAVHELGGRSNLQLQRLVVVGRAREAFVDELDAPPIEEDGSGVFYR